MRILVICPFNLERLTGTPIRTKATIKSLGTFGEVSAVDNSKIGNGENVGIFRFSKFALNSMKEYGPEYLHGVSTLSIIPIFLYKIFFDRKVKTIFEIHGWSWYELPKSTSFFKKSMFGILDYMGYRFSTGVISMSYSQKDFLFKHFGKKKNVSVIWGPADFPVNYEKVPEREVIKIGYIGNSSFWQGLDAVLDSAKETEKDNNIIFELAGFDASDSKKFPQAKNIKYVGRVERDKVKDFIYGMDIMLSPRVKGKVSDLQYPQKISEYLAGGRPIIASDTSDQRMIIERSKCGYVIEEVSGKEISSAIRKFIKLSKKDREGMSNNSASFAEKEVTMKVFKEKLNSLYSLL